MLGEEGDQPASDSYSRRASLFGLAVLIAVVAASLPRCPARRRERLKAPAMLVRRHLTGRR
jgi:hypothetical protein